MISVVVISKDEALDDTLNAVWEQTRQIDEPSEIIVVDASERRLEHVRSKHPYVRWLDYTKLPGVRISIPHQRNVGVQAAAGDVIVFIDAGCTPRSGWLAELLKLIQRGEEDVVAGSVVSRAARPALYDSLEERRTLRYLPETGSGNLAFRKSAFERVGAFDETFEYGSDVDFSWRLVQAGLRIRSAPDAIIEHGWGTRQRRLRRSYLYGRARAHLYFKHRARVRSAWRTDPVVFVYPVFLLGLPLTFVFPLYPALLAIPAWRNRGKGPLRVLVNHLAFAVGAITEAVER